MEFKSFQETVKVNGHNLVAEIVIMVDEDYYIPKARSDFDFGNNLENLKYQKRFELFGDLFSGTISVTAIAHGIKGSDVLGACHISRKNYFDSSQSYKFDKDIELLVKEHDMISNAMANLAKQIKLRANELAPYADEVK